MSNVCADMTIPESSEQNSKENHLFDSGIREINIIIFFGTRHMLSHWRDSSHLFVDGI